MRPSFSLLLGALIGLNAFAQAPAPTKTIELEWEAVENAGSYEIKLIPEGGGEPIQLNATANHVSGTVPIGNYELQVRARSKDGQDSSPWSAPMPFAVMTKELVPLFPEDGATVEGSAKLKETVEFRWTPVDKVKLYTLIVWNDERKDHPWVFTTRETRKKLDVPPAQVYHWQVKFESADDVTYQQQPKTFTFTLQGASLVKPEINPVKAPFTNASWRRSPDARQYDAKLYFHYLDESDWREIAHTQTSEVQWAFGRLKPGAYKLEVRATGHRHSPSQTAALEFTVKPTQTELTQALAKARP